MSRVVGVRLPPELNERIEEIARREYSSKSAVIRKLIAKALEKSD
ncbi:CopG family transcriptional regulator [Archaeoglobales archaeon]|nr:MAG: CopG family transcriptional regulator [Archaeoglobales archaeon]